MALNPANDDLGSSWIRNRPEKRKLDRVEPRELYAERVEREWRTEELWGREGRRPRTRRGRAIDEGSGPDSAA